MLNVAGCELHFITKSNPQIHKLSDLPLLVFPVFQVDLSALLLRCFSRDTAVICMTLKLKYEYLHPRCQIVYATQSKCTIHTLQLVPPTAWQPHNLTQGTCAKLLSAQSDPNVSCCQNVRAGQRST